MKKILIIVFTVLSGFCLFKAVTIPPEVRCGIIVKMYEGSEFKTYKSNTTTTFERYIDVNYNGYYEQVVVSTDIFYNHEVGDKICFEEPSKDVAKYLVGVFVFAMLSLILTFYTYMYL